MCGGDGNQCDRDHHERRGGEGFPGGDGTSSTSSAVASSSPTRAAAVRPSQMFCCAKSQIDHVYENENIMAIVWIYKCFHAPIFCLQMAVIPVSTFNDETFNFSLKNCSVKYPRWLKLPAIASDVIEEKLKFRLELPKLFVSSSYCYLLLRPFLLI